MPALAVILGAFAAFGGFLFGYDTGYISGLKEMPFFLSRYGQLAADGSYHLPSATDSLFTSILSAGTFIGAIVASTVGDFAGRRFGIIGYLAIFAVGVALQTWTGNIAGFACGRVLAGLGVGGVSVLVPLYQSECAPPSVRGIIVFAYQFFITVGLLIAAIVVNFTKDRLNASSYQIPVGIQFVWAFILVVGLIFLPESPRWLVFKGRTAQAQKSIARLLGTPEDSPEVIRLFDEIQGNLEREKDAGGSWKDCFIMGPGKNFQRIGTGMALQALQQLSGINFIFYYGTQFFKNSGIGNPFIITIVTNVVNVAMSVVGMLAADRVGRRSVIIAGAASMAVCQLVVAGVGAGVGADNAVGQKVLVAFVCLYIASFASSWAGMAWVVTSEIYPYHIRAKGMSLSTSSNWLFNFGIGYATPYLVNEGPGNAGLKTNVFWIWGGFCVLSVIFAYFLIPETKLLTLEQVDVLYRNTTPRKSAAYRRQMIQLGIHDSTHGEVADKSADVMVDDSHTYKA